MPSPAESNNSSDNMYSMISSVPPNGNRPNFPLGSGSDGPIGSMAGMEPHHMNGSLDHEAQTLKEHLIDELDYVLVPTEAWNKLFFI
ncbi:single-stranded DNA-binding 2-like isoform X1 [Labeo rohita]|uniref:Single-stranded DNA-binding 2-like isoform X1 n=1 Tax=Labeo rohita TaxID=84645 RepID=A0A498NYK1_LABRO|nr:single-stranded DNA-binding 2-like isoform X1 [Labeo rohita]